RDYSMSAAGNANVYALALDLVQRSDYVVTNESIHARLREHQQDNALTIAELWSFPLFLRIALIRSLTNLALAVNQGQQLSEAAYLWANRMANAARANEDAFTKILQSLEGESIARQPHFLTALAEQLQEEELAL